MALLVLLCALASCARVVQQDGAAEEAGEVPTLARRGKVLPTLLAAVPASAHQVRSHSRPPVRGRDLLLDGGAVRALRGRGLLALRGGEDLDPGALSAAEPLGGLEPAPDADPGPGALAPAEAAPEPAAEAAPEVASAVATVEAAPAQEPEEAAAPAAVEETSDPALEESPSSEAPPAAPPAEAEPEDWLAQAKAKCWGFLDQVLGLLQPNHNYARKENFGDILGDQKQLSGFAPDDESWRTQRKKMNVVDLSPAARSRVLKDLRLLKRDGPAVGIEVDDAECLTDWVVRMTGANGTVYEGEIYRLRVRFHSDYPRKPPTVTFMRPAPVHEHIYSDGRICLNILYDDWNPRMDIKSLSLSLLSMLSSAKKKGRPPDNDATVVSSLGKKTRSLQWQYDDDHC